MYITDYIMSHKSADPLYALADDCRAQMTDMQWLCDIRSAIVHNDGLRILCLFTAESACILLHLIHIGSQIFRCQLQIQKARLHRFHALKHGISGQTFRNLVRYHKRRTLVLLRCRHSSIALELAQIRAVGQRHLAVFFIVSVGNKYLRHLFGNCIN